ncbi:hypothetical protein OKJ48_41540 [Streptomyces kunmingensis]|uniref:Uncharacterized protein n=1 Tax=Streptomyces kunmingensis TaxID=68225 RepID=A0ABU6CPK6_9ACTN|nr:hypothetical protein [Streptomyces kunmingensis]MEB3966669.1 hypothetical protein [Streptomyces kunmingensis]
MPSFVEVPPPDEDDVGVDRYPGRRALLLPPDVPLPYRSSSSSYVDPEEPEELDEPEEPEES